MHYSVFSLNIKLNVNEADKSLCSKFRYAGKFRYAISMYYAMSSVSILLWEQSCVNVTCKITIYLVYT